jgi:hypothetical protein
MFACVLELGHAPAALQVDDHLKRHQAAAR